MPFIGAVFSAIASVIGAIVSTIFSVVSSIVSVIGSVIATIIGGIASVVGFISSLIKTGVGGILSRISNVISGISFVKDIGSFFAKGIEAFKATSLIYQLIDTVSGVVTKIKNFVSIIFKPISEAIRMVFNQAYYIWERIFAPVRDVIYKIKEVYIRIRQSIIGRILQKVKAISDFLSLVHTLSRVYSYIREEKYAHAIFALAYHFDETLRSEIKLIYESVSSDISDVILETRRLFQLLKSDVDGISRYTFTLADIIEDIGKNLGLKSAVEIGRFLKEDVVDAIEKVRIELNRAFKNTMSFITEVTNPFYQTLFQIYAYEREELKWKRIYRYLSLEHLHSELVLPKFDSRWYLYRVMT